MDIDKFQFWQMFNDGTGKTSVSKVTGFITCMVSVGAFASSGFIVQRASVVGILLPSDITTFLTMYYSMSLTLFGMGSAMIMVDRVKNEKPVVETENKEAANLG